MTNKFHLGIWIKVFAHGKWGWGQGMFEYVLVLFGNTPTWHQQDIFPVIIISYTTYTQC